MAKFPCYNSRHQQWNLDQHVTVNPPSSYKKVSGHPSDGLVSHGLRDQAIRLF